MKDISLYMLDLAQNSVRAEATLIRITIEQSTDSDRITLTITDNGCGMDADMVKRVQDPFVTTRTTRKVGLGIPLFRQACEDCGGAFSLESSLGVGTTISGWFRDSHIDRPPDGDIEDSMLMLLFANPDIDFQMVYRRDAWEFTFDTIPVRQVLGHDVPLSLPEVQQWIKETFAEGFQQ